MQKELKHNSLASAAVLVLVKYPRLCFSRLSCRTQTLLGKCLQLLLEVTELHCTEVLLAACHQRWKTRDCGVFFSFVVLFFNTPSFHRPPEFTFLTQKHLKQRLAPKHRGKGQTLLQVMCSLCWRTQKPHQNVMIRAKTETWSQKTLV